MSLLIKRALHDEFLKVSVATLRRFRRKIRSGNIELMADVMIHTTHAVVANVAASDPKLLNTKELEDELSLMLTRYVAK